jgi:3,4-dihydroxy 2-butanone 4-phosphate synthase/GTP cyclohydrolase II
LSNFSTIASAIKAIKQGEMLVIVDDPDRENQGDLFIPIDTLTKEAMNIMIKDCRGLVCAPISRALALKLELPLMVEPSANTEKHGCNFTISVDSKDVESFGISAADRTLSAKTLLDPKSKASDLVRPGHIFPLQASDGGVLNRTGHTEAAVDLAKLAGFSPGGVICEILDDTGEPARLDQLEKFALDHGIKLITIADLIDYEKKHNQPAHESFGSIVPTAMAVLPTEYGVYDMHVFKSIVDNKEHVALIMNQASSNEPILTRLHSKCFTGDTLGSLRCDCNFQLHKSMQLIEQKGRGLLIYLNQEGRGIGLTNKIKAYTLQDEGYDTVEANHMLGLPTDARDYEIAIEILDHLNIGTVDLLTNNPEKEAQLAANGITVRSRVPLESEPTTNNAAYLKTKKNKLGHQLTKV